MPGYFQMADEGSPVGTREAVFVGLCGICTLLIAILGCMWCQKKWKKFKEWRSQRQPFNTSTVLPTQRTNEFTIFPPPTVSQLSSVSTVSGAVLDEIVFEPLPEIRSRNLQAVAQYVRPARFTGLSRKVSLQDWFDEHQANFPRNQLKYVKEVGSAWYGQAVEGEAYSILPNEEKTKVIVKILRVDAAASDYMQFLNEARPFRDLRNPFLLRLIGQCLEVHPFLLIMEYCEMDLKTCLIQQRKSPETLLKNGLILRMACNVASAIQYMHEHGYIHCDIAAHSCVVTKDFIVKVGDYGTSLHTHKSDYYCLGDIAFPLRWCAPEALHCTESIVESKDITREANIWSVGVFLWELLEFGKLPYMELSDEEVVQKVMIESSVKLEQPKTPCIHKDMIFKIMQLCWLPPSQRPSMHRIVTLLCYLYENKDVLPDSSAFEARWNALQPVIRSHNILQQPALVAAPLRFETDFSAKNDQGLIKDCDSIMSTECSQSQYSDKSPSRGSLSTGYEGGLLTEISPSLQNLRGSIEDLTGDHSLPNESDTEQRNPAMMNIEDQDIIERTITEAIKDLDRVLADEVTSTESSNTTSPEKNTSSPVTEFHKDSLQEHNLHAVLMNGGDLIQGYNSNMHEEAGSSEILKASCSVSDALPESISNTKQGLQSS